MRGHQKRSTAEVVSVGESFISLSAKKQEKRNKSRLMGRMIWEETGISGGWEMEGGCWKSWKVKRYADGDEEGERLRQPSNMKRENSRRGSSRIKWQQRWYRWVRAVHWDKLRRNGRRTVAKRVAQEDERGTNVEKNRIYCHERWRW